MLVLCDPEGMRYGISAFTHNLWQTIYIVLVIHRYICYPPQAYLKAPLPLGVRTSSVCEPSFTTNCNHAFSNAPIIRSADPTLLSFDYQVPSVKGDDHCTCRASAYPVYTFPLGRSVDLPKSVGGKNLYSPQQIFVLWRKNSSCRIAQSIHSPLMKNY